MEKKLIIVGVILDKEGRILLTQRHDPKFPDAHLKWDLPGGRHESGETLEETLIREVLEETGYKVKIERMIPYHAENFWQAADGQQEVVVLGFKGHVTAGKPHLNDPKIVDIKWLKPAEIKNYDTLLGTPEFIAAALS